MSRALTLLFRAFRRYRDTHPAEAALMRFHFIGTDYAPPPLGRYWALPVAEAEGVADQVAEHCYRVAYFDALHYLVSADALLAVGSNDPTYSASKIFPYLLARRPLLVIVHRGSLMLSLARELGVATAYGFGDDSEDFTPQFEQIHAEWFVAGGFRQTPPGDLAPLEDHTARGMSARLAAIFDQAVSAS